MPLDRAHEQISSNVKENRGSVTFIEDLVASSNWMVSGPEEAHIQEFEAIFDTAINDAFYHHETSAEA